MAKHPALPPAVDVRRADERFHTRIGWLDSHHSFSFSSHYDPANTHHGLLLVSNDDTVRAGTGFRTHPHQDMEIVTWVLDGSSSTRTPRATAACIYPGLAQRMSAGTGIWHSEMNPRHAGVHFVQMWVPPDIERIGRATSSSTSTPSLTPAGSCRSRRAAATTRPSDPPARGRALGWAPEARGAVTVPDAPYVHVFVARGSVTLEGAGALAAGDAPASPPPARAGSPPIPPRAPRCSSGRPPASRPAPDAGARLTPG